MMNPGHRADYSPDQREWVTRERARRAMLEPGRLWRNRSRTGARVKILALEGVTVRFQRPASQRQPAGEGRMDLAAFLRNYSPVSAKWRKEK